MRTRVPKRYLKTCWGYIPKQRLSQCRNPVSECYVAVDTEVGRIVSHHPRRNTPYKDVEIK